MDVRSTGATDEKVGPSRHGGQGNIRQWRLYNAEDFVSKLSGVTIDIVPPGSEIGLHYHESEEEIYFILEGEAVMLVNDQEHLVHGGDMILTQPGNSHGLKNASSADVRLMAVEVRM